MISSEYKIKAILAFNHIAFIAGVLVASPQWLLLTLVGFIFINRIGGEIALHRLFAHKSFKTVKWKEYVLTALSIFNCVGSPIMWVGIHRKHHALSDTDLDPHSSKQSIIRVWATFWKPYRIEPKYIIDLYRDKFHRFVHDNYFTILIGIYAALGIIAWQIPIFLISGSSLITLHSAGLVNTICHRYGYVNFKTVDHSKNNTLVNLITFGSGLHNNHHAYPNNYSNKVSKYEYDLPAWIILHFLIKR